MNNATQTKQVTWVRYQLLINGHPIEGYTEAGDPATQARMTRKLAKRAAQHYAGKAFDIARITLC